MTSEERSKWGIKKVPDKKAISTDHTAGVEKQFENAEFVATKPPIKLTEIKRGTRIEDGESGKEWYPDERIDR